MTKERVCANGTYVSRRSILAAVPLAALPAVSIAATEDPILKHYQDWKAARTEWYRYADLPGHESWETSEMLAAQDAEDVALEAMMVTPPTTFAGVAALAHVIWKWSGPSAREDSPDFDEQCEWVENRLIAALWRAASGQEGLPR